MTKLWKLPLQTNPKPTQSIQNYSSKCPIDRQSKYDNSNWITPTFKISNTVDTISNTIHMSTLKDLIKFYNQCLFSPPKSSWITVNNNHKFTCWTGLAATAIQQTSLYQQQLSRRMPKSHHKTCHPQLNQPKKENHCIYTPISRVVTWKHQSQFSVGQLLGTLRTRQYTSIWLEN